MTNEERLEEIREALTAGLLSYSAEIGDCLSWDDVEWLLEQVEALERYRDRWKAVAKERDCTCYWYWEQMTSGCEARIREPMRIGPVHNKPTFFPRGGRD